MEEESSDSGGDATREAKATTYKVRSCKGCLYYSSLLKSESRSPCASESPALAPKSGRGTLLFVLAVPTRLSPDDFIRFCGPCVEYALEIRVVRNAGMEDRYSVLVEFEDQKSADGFYLDLNGRRFSSSEGEVCHVLFLGSAEYTSSMEIATTPPIGSTELPTCPVCIGPKSVPFHDQLRKYLPTQKCWI